jgi:hypothetical protein
MVGREYVSTEKGGEEKVGVEVGRTGIALSGDGKG